MRKVINLFCAAALLGGTVLMPVSGWAEQRGGLVSNNVSGGTASIQKGWTLAVQVYGLITSGVAAVIEPWAPFNFDFLGEYLDYRLYKDAKNRKARWSEPIEPLQAAIRQMGSAADLMACEGEESEKSSKCNALNATLDRTNVHINALKNVGLEAIQDKSGDLLDTPEELATGEASEYIQKGFGTETVAFDASSKLPDVSGLSEEEKKKLEEEVKKNQQTRTEVETQNIHTRKMAHLQKMGTAGVARADLGATVARSEKAIDKNLTSFVGSGNGLIAQVKVLCGLDLTLAQRLNLLNMLQGQQVANEAAMGLQFIEE